jgi:hypothetical protein
LKLAHVALWCRDVDRAAALGKVSLLVVLVVLVVVNWFQGDARDAPRKTAQ